MLWCQETQDPMLFQVADVDSGVINWVNADLLSHIDQGLSSQGLLTRVFLLADLVSAAPYGSTVLRPEGPLPTARGPRLLPFETPIDD